MRSMSDTLPMSASIARLLRPCAVMLAAVCFTLTLLMSTATTSAPAAARLNAEALPMPCPAPVTSATCPDNGIAWFSSPTLGLDFGLADAAVRGAAQHAARGRAGVGSILDDDGAVDNDRRARAAWVK